MPRRSLPKLDQRRLQPVIVDCGAHGVAWEDLEEGVEAIRESEELLEPPKVENHAWDNCDQ